MAQILQKWPILACFCAMKIVNVSNMGKMCYFIDILLRCNELTLYDGIWVPKPCKNSQKKAEIAKNA